MSQWFSVYGFADVQDNLLVGAYPLDQEDVDMLEYVKIERVLNLVEDEEYEPGERLEVEQALRGAGIEEHRLTLTDYGRLPAPKLEAAVAEVIGWLDQGHRVYLHCRAGWQRSAAVAAGVVALTEGVGVEQALDLVNRRKPSADPLPQQRADLLHWWAERDQRGDAAGAGDGTQASDDAAHAGLSVDETDDLLRWLHGHAPRGGGGP
jgi:protein-tyrosine phosphatase